MTYLVTTEVDFFEDKAVARTGGAGRPACTTRRGHPLDFSSRVAARCFLAFSSVYEAGIAWRLMYAPIAVRVDRAPSSLPKFAGLTAIHQLK